MIFVQSTLLNASDGGKLGIQLRNQRFTKKRTNTSSEIDTLDEKEAEQLFEEMKLTIVNNENMEKLKLLLAKTLPYRSKLLKDIHINLRECFPLFFVSHEMVIAFCLQCCHLFISRACKIAYLKLFSDFARVFSSLSKCR